MRYKNIVSIPHKSLLNIGYFFEVNFFAYGGSKVMIYSSCIASENV